jgi:probable O-glycosylation ligase (exosortase A-associated)
VRDDLILAAIYVSLPIILLQPYFGLLVYSWLGYMRPQGMAWGVSRDAPLSAWVAIAMLAGIAFALGREKLFTWKTQTVLLGLLGLWISLTTWKAVSPDAAALVYGYYWKAILISVITTGLVRDHRRLRILMLVIALSIGFLGAKSGVFGLLRGGTRFDEGPGGMMSDNTTYALGLNMVVPLLVGIVIAERSQILRLLAAVMTLLSVLTILFTFSRGGLLTLCAVGALLIWRSQQRLVATGVLVLGIVGFLAFSSPQLKEDYVARAQTIGSYEEDGSAQGRLRAWGISWRVFRDHPLLGVGPNNLLTVSPSYSNSNSDKEQRYHVAHNSYFELLAECGWPSVVLFLLVLGVTLARLNRLRRFPAAAWVETYAEMMQISIVAYMTGSLFLNMAYFDLIYHLVGMSVSLEVAAAACVRGGAEAIVAVDDPWWRRTPVASGASGGVGIAPKGTLTGGMARVKGL